MGDGLRVTALAPGTMRSGGLVLPSGLGERVDRLLLKDHRSVSADRYPLARFHKRLLGQPLAYDLIQRGGTADSLTVPAGSRLRRFRNDGPFHSPRRLRIRLTACGARRPQTFA